MKKVALANAVIAGLDCLAYSNDVAYDANPIRRSKIEHYSWQRSCKNLFRPDTLEHAFTGTDGVGGRKANSRR